MFFGLFSKRRKDTEKMATSEIRSIISGREKNNKPCGVAYGVLADHSDNDAKRFNIDPPRPGRKSYSERYAETSSMSADSIRATIATREAQGKPCGVLYRRLSDIT
jgi:hypothetical protein